MKMRFWKFLTVLVAVIGLAVLTVGAKTYDYTIILSNGSISGGSEGEAEKLGISSEMAEDYSQVTYTFDNVQFETTAPIAIEIYGDIPVRIRMVGDSTVKGGGIKDAQYASAGNETVGIWAASYDPLAGLTFTGDGSLSVTAGESLNYTDVGGHSTGIIAQNITVESGSVYVYSGNAVKNSIGITARGECKVTGGYLRALAGDNVTGIDSYITAGIRAWDMLVTGGEVLASGYPINDGEENSYGVYAYSSLEMSGGSLTMQGASCAACFIYPYKNMSVLASTEKYNGSDAAALPDGFVPNRMQYTERYRYLQIEYLGIPLNETTFPDSVFRDHVCGKVDWDGNGYLSDGEIASMTDLELNETAIRDLTGIEYLSALEYFSCADSMIRSLDLTENKALRELCLYDNDGLQTLKLDNPILEYVDIDRCALLSLDTGSCLSINVFGCYDNSAYVGVDENRQLDLSTLQEGFDAARIMEVVGGTLSDGILTVDADADMVDYRYDSGRGRMMDVSLQIVSNYTLLLKDGKVYKNSADTVPLTDIGITGAADGDGGYVYRFEYVQFGTTAPVAMYIDDTHATIRMDDTSEIYGCGILDGEISETCGIYAAGDLTVIGQYKLHVEAAVPHHEIGIQYGIYVNGTLTVEDGALTVDSGSAHRGYGIFADKIRIIESDVSVDARKPEIGYALVCRDLMDGITVTGSEVTLEASYYVTSGEHGDPIAPVTVDETYTNVAAVRAGCADTSAQKYLWDWQGNGLDSVDGYRFLHLMAPGNHDCRYTGQGWQEWNESASMPTEAGWYTLSCDVTLNETWRPANGTVLCLAGYDIKVVMGTLASVITVPEDCRFTLCDCNWGGRWRYGKWNETGDYMIQLLNVSSNRELVGGFVTGSIRSAVAVESGAVFQMYGGNLVGNRASNGGGVYNTGEFRMYGGTIAGNCADDGNGNGSGGGVYNLKNKGKFHMFGGTVADNIAVDGGGVYVDDQSDFWMYDGELICNTATKSGVGTGGGGGIWSNGRVTVYSGKIADNTAAEDGGGIYVYRSRTSSATAASRYLYLYGGEITGNVTEGSGGGIRFGGNAYISDVLLFLNGSVKIMGNTKQAADSSGTDNNLYLAQGERFDILVALTEGAAIGISLAADYDRSMLLSSGFGGEMYAGYFQSDDPRYTVITADGGIMLSEEVPPLQLLGMGGAVKVAVTSERDATLYVAQYLFGRMIDIRQRSITAGEPYTELLPAGVPGADMCAFLLDGQSCPITSAVFYFPPVFEDAVG